MPLMVFIGEKGRTRRSKEALARRKVKQEKTDFTRERIEAFKRGEQWSGRGRGAPSWSGDEISRAGIEKINSLNLQPASRVKGPSSSSSWSANDPKRTAWQDKSVWDTGWSSNDNWGWKQ